MNKKLIIFDIDGVITDTAQFLVEYKNIEFLDVTLESVQKMYEKNIFESMEEMSHKRKSLSADELQEKREEYRQRKNKQATVFIGVPELLQELSKNFVLAINTSSTEENFIPIFARYDIERYFDFFASSHLSKSKVDKFRIILDRYNIQPSEAVFVTDTVGDMVEADLVGIPTIGVLYGLHDKVHFNRSKTTNCLSLVENLTELKEQLLS